MKNKSQNYIESFFSNKKKLWLITGVAGFIGSNLLEALLSLDQCVIGVDNFSTGSQTNLEDVRSVVSISQWNNFSFINGDICNMSTCRQICDGVDYVLHHAALGSIPRSIKDPIITNESNLSGYLNMLVAARDANVKRFIYASSSSVYGDSQVLPKIEHTIGRPLSPYTITKLVNELYADIFFQTYGLETIGLRYFNVFGRRQNSIGAYSAVIPTWISGMLNNETIYINGDGETSRDFCYIDNVIQANLLAAVSSNPLAVNQVYNIAVGEQTTLNQLYYHLRDCLSIKFLYLNEAHPVYREFRPGDIRHSLADIQKAREIIGYEPLYRASDGLNHSIKWYVDSYLSNRSLKK